MVTMSPIKIGNNFSPNIKAADKSRLRRNTQNGIIPQQLTGETPIEHEHLKSISSPINNGFKVKNKMLKGNSFAPDELNLVVPPDSLRIDDKRQQRTNEKNSKTPKSVLDNRQRIGGGSPFTKVFGSFFGK